MAEKWYNLQRPELTELVIYSNYLDLKLQTENSAALIFFFLI